MGSRWEERRDRIRAKVSIDRILSTPIGERAGVVEKDITEVLSEFVGQGIDDTTLILVEERIRHALRDCLLPPGEKLEFAVRLNEKDSHRIDIVPLNEATANIFAEFGQENQ